MERVCLRNLVGQLLGSRWQGLCNDSLLKRRAKSFSHRLDCWRVWQGLEKTLLQNSIDFVRSKVNGSQGAGLACGFIGKIVKFAAGALVASAQAGHNYAALR
jgi:hypothetical protein